jgi:hypothetical protein
MSLPMKTLPFILLALASLMLAACSGTTVGAAAAYYGITHTRPDEGPPADVEDQTAPHESWCYETMGYAECYAHPKIGADNRLINVDPQNRYPLTHADYDALAAREGSK